MTDEQLAAIRARANAATPGPWTSYEKNPTDEYYASCFPADEEFIGHSREDIPALLDEVERLRTENERLRAELETVRGLLAEGRTTGHDIRAAALEAENHIIMLLNGDTALDAAGGK